MARGLVLVCVALMAGCGGHVYQRPAGMDASRWNTITEQCWDHAYATARGEVGVSAGSSYETAFRAAFDACMQRHGFRREWRWGMVK